MFLIFYEDAGTGSGLPPDLLSIVNAAKGKPVAISQPSATASAGPGDVQKKLLKKLSDYFCI